MAKKKRSKAKKNINKVPFIAGGVILAIAVVGFVAYSIISPSPEERVARGIVKLLDSNVVSIESTSVTQGEDSTTTSSIKAITDKKVLDASFSSKLESQSQDAAEVKASVVIPESGDMYAKIDNPKESLRTMIDARLNAQFSRSPGENQQGDMMNNMRTLMGSYVDTVASKIGDNWVRIPKQDLSLSTPSQEVAVGCYIDFVGAAKADAGARKQLIEQFNTHTFLVIEEDLASKGTSAGYLVAVDQNILDKFVEASKDNKVLRKALECDPTLSLLTDASSGRMSIWVDKISHTITHMELSGDTSGTGMPAAKTEVKFGYTGRVEATQPKSSIDVAELTGVLGQSDPGMAE